MAVEEDIEEDEPRAVEEDEPRATEEDEPREGRLIVALAQVCGWCLPARAPENERAHDFSRVPLWIIAAEERVKAAGRNSRAGTLRVSVRMIIPSHARHGAVV